MLDETGGPNIGPFFCGGLVTRNRLDGSLSFSGQYKAFRHISGFVGSESRVYKAAFDNEGPIMSSYPNVACPLEGVVVENTDSTALILVNPHTEKSQVQYFADGNWWYIELLPNTVATVVFEK